MAGSCFPKCGSRFSSSSSSSTSLLLFLVINNNIWLKQISLGAVFRPLAQKRAVVVILIPLLSCLVAMSVPSSQAAREEDPLALLLKAARENSATLYPLEQKEKRSPLQMNKSYQLSERQRKQYWKRKTVHTVNSHNDKKEWLNESWFESQQNQRQGYHHEAFDGVAT